MILNETTLPGVFIVEPEPMEDERGFFARVFGAAEFAERGLEAAVAECSIAYNPKRWTLRGLHYQLAPHQETKLVRCTRGAAYDVAVDLRLDSPTYLRWEAIELTAENRLALQVPPGCAHGYLTLEDGCELLYQISHRYEPAAAAGVRWNDPLIGIEWPTAPAVISQRDASFPALESHR
ncbi:MAG: dTDP-4-dehydrorhamnose 3,5-epimerase [Chloroflexi bacterium]|nr:dTDP-4-dehydrorhamnose 3,5-epimerase [Chloroflexota bacterium]